MAKSPSIESTRRKTINLMAKWMAKQARKEGTLSNDVSYFCGLRNGLHLANMVHHLDEYGIRKFLKRFNWNTK